MMVVGAWIILVQAFARAKKTKAPSYVLPLTRGSLTLNNLILSPLYTGVKRNDQVYPDGADSRVYHGFRAFIIDAR
ncbi:hypothetical protein PROVRUST_07903 [Providencia rustigianii DSM 4541]|uniref:Uncharacterized protein n=1 Tax=Providencia rustigianii DSM 4541 TaxID=500637 RepID=D1P6I1_9GAMM|nr:hypothetical protein PROVRUST_07903 [Providencia rustigianii DSM 4541]